MHIYIYTYIHTYNKFIKIVKKRIIFIYKRCITKFPKDLSILFDFMNYLIKSKSTKTINKVIGRSLLTNPSEIDIWKFAVYYEYEVNNNIQNSRELFQKCIRINERNINAHLEYFIFEIVFVEKVLQRRLFLKQKELEFISGENEKNDKFENDIDVNESSSNDEVLNLVIPRIIFDNAIKINSHKDIKEYNHIIDLFLNELSQHSSNLDDRDRGLSEYIHSKKRIYISNCEDIEKINDIPNEVTSLEIDNFSIVNTILVDIPNNLSMILRNNHILSNKLTLKKSFDVIYHCLFQFYKADIVKVVYSIIKSFPKSSSFLPTVINYCLNEVFEYDLLNFDKYLNEILRIFVEDEKEILRTTQSDAYKEILYYIVKYLLGSEVVISRNNLDLVKIRSVLQMFNKENSKKLINFKYLFEDVVKRFQLKGFSNQIRIRDIKCFLLDLE